MFFFLKTAEIDIEVSVACPIFSGEQLSKWYVQIIV